MIDTQTKELQPHQQRVVDERKELKDRHAKLYVFIHENPYYLNLLPIEQELLTKQEEVMAELIGILDERIHLF